MSGDTLVFDMSSQSEGSPSVFVRKDWLSILDNQNQNYQGNQSVIDTSQLANSNKYMNYREAYFLLPMIMTMTGQAAVVPYFQPAVAATSMDFGLGLKNWYGSIIHSFTLDYNGTTIIQQTPYVGLWNTFKLMTSLSYDDLITQSSQLGFYPDTPLAWSYSLAGGQSGLGTCNNINAGQIVPVSGQFSSGSAFNEGLLKRQLAWAYDPDGTTGPEIGAQTYGYLLPTASVNQLWKSYINGKSNQTANAGAGAGSTGGFQVSISAIIYLKHIASFFERVPLLKGVFMKMTMNLNQSSVAFSTTATNTKGNITVAVANTGIATVSVIPAGLSITIGDFFQSAAGDDYQFAAQITGPNGGLGTYLMSNQTVLNPAAVVALISDVNIIAFQAVVPNSPLGGVQPIMIASGIGSSASPYTASANNALVAGSYTVSIAVGNKVLNSTNLTQIGTLGAASPAGGVVAAGPLSGSVILNVPAYTFNPVFESSYLSSPVKKIVYTDIYQYQIVNTIRPNQNFNNLISNGIANIKSVLVLPFFSAVAGNPWSSSPLLSPFDPAGGGPTSPLCLFNQFNIQISGQNAIYNTERYAYEQFQNQLYGTNAVNAGQTDGMTSGLIDALAFENEYSYYYVNCGRMLPVEEAVPKSINILGLSMSTQAVDLFVFVEYGVEVSLDILTGARV